MNVGIIVCRVWDMLMLSLGFNVSYLGDAVDKHWFHCVSSLGLSDDESWFHRVSGLGHAVDGMLVSSFVVSDTC